MLGTVIESRYRIERVLGVGGVGVVYEARHLRLQHLVALKLLRGGFDTAPLVKRRFEREARVLSELSHPNIVGLTDYGMHDGAPYLVMERLEGRGLEVWLAEEVATPAEGIRIMKDVLRGLAFAHDKGFLHRDIKPANIFLQKLADGEEHPKLVDFGLAKLFASDADEEEGEGEPTLTRAGSILGTPAYMAPEQASGSTVGTAADVYSAGVVLFEILAGRPPFSADRRTELLRQHMIDDVPDPSFFRAGLETTPELRALLLRALAKEPAARHKDGRELLAALEALPLEAAWVQDTDRSDATRSVVRRTLVSRPTKSGPRAPWLYPLIALVVGAALVGAVWALVGSEESSTNRRASAVGAAGNAVDEAEPERRSIEEVMPAPETALLDGADPFSRPMPEALAHLASSLAESEELDRDAHRETRLYQRLHPEDPRPTLLLAHDLADRASWPQAVERYELAYSRWPETMGDPHMQRDLILALVQGEEGAARLLVLAFGEDAVPAVQERLAHSEHRPTRLLLRRLINRLRAEDSPSESETIP
ncbi:MAG: serine/threonine protein kinase [Polyangiales bacterium]|jgi:serine/threonine protein kinase